MEKNQKYLLLVAILGVLAIYAFLGNTGAKSIVVNSNSEATNAITVTASGKASAESDMAFAVISVKTTANTAKESQDQNALASDSVVKAIKGADRVKTTSYSIYPNYEYKPSRITGYTTTHQIRFGAGPDDMGTLIDAATDAGANNIGSISFTLKDETRERLQDEALGLATKAAKEKAKTIASAGGVGVGKLVSISESGYAPVSYVQKAYSLGAESMDTSFEAGDVEVTVSVTASYTIE